MADAIYTTCPVVHEDQWLLVIDKPHGVLSHPNRGDAESRCAFAGPWDDDTKTFATPAGQVWLMHRLDQDTSGTLLAAKDARTADALRQLFEQNEIRKFYRVLASGGGLRPEGVWLDHLRVNHQKRQVRTEVVRGARPNAEARFRVLRYDPALRTTVLDIELVTGKTHQIRVQCASRRQPVVGDDVYGDFARNRALRKDPGIKRLCLHARELRFKHPVTRKEIIAQAPLPADIEPWMRDRI